MVSISLSLPVDYWKNLKISKQDLEALQNHLFEVETPLTEKELVEVLVRERIRVERQALLEQQQGGDKTYIPKERYKKGDGLAFPALDWKKGKVTRVRQGVNPEVKDFQVIEVELEDGEKRHFAAGLEAHKLNQPIELDPDDQLLKPETIMRLYAGDIEQKLAVALKADEGLVRIAGRWFPRSLLVDVNIGHLNLAEAVLDEAKGKPLPAPALLEQVELPANVNPKLIEFSMNFALQEDKDARFDEVGPAGEVLWCLRRLEPEDVRQIPKPLHYTRIDYDRKGLTGDMLALEEELADEWSEIPPSSVDIQEAVISLTYPHWRAGTLPVSSQVRSLFPTAYESPRVRFTLVDSATSEEIPAWVVRQNRYVAGLGMFYNKHELIPGSLVVVRKGKQPGSVIIQAKSRRPTRDWVRTVLVGRDGGIVFAMLKQNLSTEYNERMVVYVPDAESVDQAKDKLTKQKLPLEDLVTALMRELMKLNVQGHIHAQELYSAINIVRRCPPAPLLATLVTGPEYVHVGDLHYRLADTG